MSASGGVKLRPGRARRLAAPRIPFAAFRPRSLHSRRSRMSGWTRRSEPPGVRPASHQRREVDRQAAAVARCPQSDDPVTGSDPPGQPVASRSGTECHRLVHPAVARGDPRPGPAALLQPITARRSSSSATVTCPSTRRGRREWPSGTCTRLRRSVRASLPRRGRRGAASPAAAGWSTRPASLRARQTTPGQESPAAPRRTTTRTRRQPAQKRQGWSGFGIETWLEAISCAIRIAPRDNPARTVVVPG